MTTEPQQPDESGGDDRTRTSGALLASGFPFQIAVKKHLEGMQWRTLEEEFPWRDPLGKDEFLDIVVAGPSPDQPVIAAVECKKTLKEAYTFLLDEYPSLTDRFTGVGAYVLESVNDRARVQLRVGDWDTGPPSLESAYCVISDANRASERLLEREAQKLVRATDAFAMAYRDGVTKAGKRPSGCLFVPVLVTNAKIYAVPFAPLRDVSLVKGGFKGPPPTTDDVEYARFRKAFVAGARDQPSERSVLVVNVEKLAAVMSYLGRNTRNPGSDTWILG